MNTFKQYSLNSVSSKSQHKLKWQVKYWLKNNMCPGNMSSVLLTRICRPFLYQLIIIYWTTPNLNAQYPVFTIRGISVKNETKHIWRMLCGEAQEESAGGINTCSNIRSTESTSIVRFCNVDCWLEGKWALLHQCNVTESRILTTQIFKNWNRCCKPASSGRFSAPPARFKLSQIDT